jgi:hypothetical protein
MSVRREILKDLTVVTGEAGCNVAAPRTLPSTPSFYLNCIGVQLNSPNPE